MVGSSRRDRSFPGSARNGGGHAAPAETFARRLEAKDHCWLREQWDTRSSAVPGSALAVGIAVRPSVRRGERIGRRGLRRGRPIGAATQSLGEAPHRRGFGASASVAQTMAARRARKIRATRGNSQRRQAGGGPIERRHSDPSNRSNRRTVEPSAGRPVGVRCGSPGLRCRERPRASFPTGSDAGTRCGSAPPPWSRGSSRPCSPGSAR